MPLFRRLWRGQRLFAAGFSRTPARPETGQPDEGETVGVTEARHEGAAPTAPSPGSMRSGSTASGDAGSGAESGGEESGGASSPSADSDLPSPILARAAHENFPVASRLLPPRLRRHLIAVYAFARLVDDVGDEAAGDRWQHLDAIETDLVRVFDGSPRLPVMRELSATVHACGIPREPFQRLVEANRQDQLVGRYESFESLLGYCALSANPVGHIVLHILGAATSERMALSDRVCSALQLAEHWQDVAEDLASGRIYLPAEDLSRFGVTEDDLMAPTAASHVRELLAFETRRARHMLDEGAPLVHTLSGFGRLATAGYVAGGRAALRAIAANDHDVLSSTPRPRRTHVASAWLLMLAGRG